MTLAKYEVIWFLSNGCLKSPLNFILSNRSFIIKNKYMRFYCWPISLYNLITKGAKYGHRKNPKDSNWLDARKQSI